MSTPTGKGREFDAFNDDWRADPEVRAKLQSMGVNPDAPMRLSGGQRAELEQFGRQKFPEMDGKFQIDPAGNWNTDHGLSTAWSNPYFRTALIAGGTLGVGMAVAPAAFGIGAGGSAGASAGAGGAAAAGGGAAAAGGGISAGTVASAAGAGGGFWGTAGRFLGSRAGEALIGAGTNIAGNVMADRADRRAGEAEERMFREGLEYEKERDRYDRTWAEEDRGFRRGVYDRAVQDFAPFQQQAPQVAARLSEMAGRVPVPVTAEGLYGMGDVPAMRPPTRVSQMVRR